MSNSLADINALVVPFIFASSLLLIFFWMSITSKYMTPANYCNKFLIPTVIFIIIIFVFFIAMVIATQGSFDSNTTLVFVAGAVLLFLLLLIAIGYFVGAIRIYYTMRTKTTVVVSSGKKPSSRVERITKQTVGCGVAIIVSFLCAVTLVQPELRYNIGLSYALGVVIEMMFTVISLLQISIFGMEGDKSSRSSEKKTKTKNTTESKISSEKMSETQ